MFSSQTVSETVLVTVELSLMQHKTCSDRREH